MAEETAIPIITLSDVTGSTVSKDGDQMVFQVEDKDGDEILLILPTKVLSRLKQAILNLTNMILFKAGGTVKAAARKPASLTVGHSVDMPGQVAFMFDQGTAEETIFVVPDAAALHFVDNVRRDITGRNSEADAAARKLQGMAAPTPRNKIILPS